MKFFIDTANVAGIMDVAASGLLDGATTNPPPIRKAGRPMLDVIKDNGLKAFRDDRAEPGQSIL